MRRIRVIPLMLIDNGKAVVTRQFSKPIYVGDPINAMKVFNEKEVDEMLVVDITAPSKMPEPDFDLLSKLASESFMPLTYGGRVSTMRQVETIIGCGIEKISFNTSIFNHPDLINEVATRFGKQSVVASLDIKRNLFGKYVIKINRGRQSVNMNLEQCAAHLMRIGVGEVALTSMDHDGMLCGYHYDLIRQLSKLVNVPIIACGGASSVADFVKAVENGASAVAAGAMFYFKGGFSAVLINYPEQQFLKKNLYEKI